MIIIKINNIMKENNKIEKLKIKILFLWVFTTIVKSKKNENIRDIPPRSSSIFIFGNK